MAQEQVNVELKLVADAESAIKEIEQNLKGLRDKAVKIPVEFDVKTTGDTGKDVKSLTAQYTRQISSLKQQSDFLSRQEASLSRQVKTYKELASAQKRLAGSGAGARVQQTALGNFDQARKDIKNTETQLNITRNALKGASAETQIWGRALKKVQDDAKKTTSSFASLGKLGSGGFFSSLLGKLTLGGIAVEAFKQGLSGLGNVLQQGIDFQQLEISLEAFAGGAERAAALYQNFKETAIKTPFSLGDVAGAGKTLLAFGLDVEEVSGATDKLAVIAGATGSNLNNLARNLGQISAQGRAFTRDLNQFATAGIPIFTELAKVLGVSVEEVRKLTEAGSVGFEDVQAALDNLTTAGSSFAQVAGRQVDTVQGQIGNLQTSVQELSAELVKAASPNIVRLFKFLSEAIGNLAENSTEIISVVTGLGLAFSGLKGFQLISDSSLVNNIKAIGQLKVLKAEYTQLIALRDQLSASGTFNPAALQEVNRQIALTQQGLDAAKAQATAFGAALKGLAISAGITAGIIALTLVFNKFREAATKSFGAITSQAEQLKSFNKELKNQLAGAAIVDDKDITRVQDLTRELQKADDAFSGVSAAAGGIVLINPALIGITGAIAGLNRELKQTEFDKLLKDIDKVGDKSEAVAGNLKLLGENALAVGDPEAIRKQLGQQANFIEGQTASILVLTKQLEVYRAAQEKSFDANRQKTIESLTASLNKQKAALGQIIPLYRKLSESVKPKELLAKGLGGDLKSAQDFAKQASDRFKELKERVDSIGAADLAPIKTDLAELKSIASSITSEYDRQNAKLKEQKTTVDAILRAFTAEEELAAARAVGPEEERLAISNKIRENEREIRALRQGGPANQEEINNLVKENAALGVKLKNIDKIKEAQIQQAEKELQIAENARDAATASEGVRTAYAEASVDAQVLQNNTDATKASLDQIITKAEAIRIGENLPEDIGEAVDEAAKLESDLQQLSRQNFEVNATVTVDTSALNKLRAAGIVIDTNQFRAAGGPVDGGSKYTVNELGKEAFLGASGRLSMINAKSWGTWRAPEDGVVIPAHLTKKLDVPSGGVNLNNPRSAAAVRRTGSVDRGSSSRANQMLHSMQATQRLQAQQLGRLTAAIDTMAGKDWSVDVNINGNNPLLNKLRRTR